MFVALSALLISHLWYFYTHGGFVCHMFHNVAHVAFGLLCTQSGMYVSRMHCLQTVMLLNYQH